MEPNQQDKANWMPKYIHINSEQINIDSWTIYVSVWRCQDNDSIPHDIDTFVDIEADINQPYLIILISFLSPSAQKKKP